MNKTEIKVLKLNTNCQHVSSLTISDTYILHHSFKQYRYFRLVHAILLTTKNTHVKVKQNRSAFENITVYVVLSNSYTHQYIDNCTVNY